MKWYRIPQALAGMAVMGGLMLALSHCGLMGSSNGSALPATLPHLADSNQQWLGAFGSPAIEQTAGGLTSSEEFGPYTSNGGASIGVAVLLDVHGMVASLRVQPGMTVGAPVDPALCALFLPADFQGVTKPTLTVHVAAGAQVAYGQSAIVAATFGNGVVFPGAKAPPAKHPANNWNVLVIENPSDCTVSAMIV